MKRTLFTFSSLVWGTALILGWVSTATPQEASSRQSTESVRSVPIPGSAIDLPIPESVRTNVVAEGQRETSASNPQLPSVRRPAGGEAQSDPASLMHNLAKLRAECERLKDLQSGTAHPNQSAKVDKDDGLLLRLKAQSLLQQLQSQRVGGKKDVVGCVTAKDTPVEATPTRTPESARNTAQGKLTFEKAPTGPSNPPELQQVSYSISAETSGELRSQPLTDHPTDILGWAGNAFLTGDYEDALRAYRLIDTTALGRRERVEIQYLTACCLRATGKLREAESLFREVCSAQTEPLLVECARWQIERMNRRKSAETRLREIQQCIKE